MRIRTELKVALFLTDLARCGSIGKTAALHHLAPSTVLRHLRTFEKSCGKILLATTPNGTGLTDTGLLLAARLEKDITASLAPVRRGPHETLTVWLDERLSCPTTATAIFRWATDLADIVRLTRYADKADLLISLAAPKRSQHTFTRVFAASPGYLADAGIPYTFSNLTSHTLILCESDAARFDGLCPRNLIVPTLFEGLNAAESGLGLFYGVTEKLITPQRQAGVLSIVPLSAESAQTIQITSTSSASAELLLSLWQQWMPEF